MSIESPYSAEPKASPPLVQRTASSALALLSGGLHACVRALLTLPDQDIASAIELVKVSVYYVLEQPIQLQALRECLQKALGDGPPVTATFIPLPRLNDNQQVVCDAYFLTNRAKMPERVARLEGAPIAETTTARVVDGLRCGELAWCSGQIGLLEQDGTSVTEQTRQTLNKLSRTLELMGLSAAQVVKFNTWRAPPPSQQDYTQAAKLRFDWLSATDAAVTGITVPLSLHEANALIQIEVWAHADTTRQRLYPEDHWHWPSPTPYAQGVSVGRWVFVGGQAALDAGGAVLSPQSYAEQRTITLQYVAAVLKQAGASESDCLARLEYHTSARTSPSREATQVPVVHLAYPNQLIEVDAIAWR
ncbi:MAG: hypothetical protein CMQ61_03360 [Gammaproteobacteria bacterium]|nr:hypothetical protein [Gammaproteobacteria bacterium]